MPLDATVLLATYAVLLDWLLGEPRRWHPLVAFGRMATWLENRLNGAAQRSPRQRRRRGILALATLLIGGMGLAVGLTAIPIVGDWCAVLLLYLALGHHSLHQHARPVALALQQHDETTARALAARMVSRDAETLDSANAVTESVLENGNDAVFGALFWFLLAGGAGVVLYRLANTLDAMWGYRSERYQDFGWAAARLDDALNYLPARLTAVTYALLGDTRVAFSCWREQAPRWDSPNAGPVMAAGAGALQISLGGPARYREVWHPRPRLGVGAAAGFHDIERALTLVRHGVWGWLGLLVILTWVLHHFR